MVISIPIPKFMVDFWWFLNDRCSACGGEVEEKINGKYYCKECDTKN